MAGGKMTEEFVRRLMELAPLIAALPPQTQREIERSKKSMAPKFWSFRAAEPSPGATQTSIRSACRKMKEDGAAWLRVTAVNAEHQPCQPDENPAGFWIEGWQTRPDIEGPFDPPLTEGGTE